MSTDTSKNINNYHKQKIWVGNITPWNAWTSCDYCKLCKNGPLITSFEFDYSINDEEKYVREACTSCTRDLIKHDAEYNDIEIWKKSIKEGKNTYNIFVKYGLIDEINFDD